MPVIIILTIFILYLPTIFSLLSIFRFVAIVVIRAMATEISTESAYDDAATYTSDSLYYIAAAWDNVTVINSDQFNTSITVGDRSEYTVRPPGSQDKVTYRNWPLRSNTWYCSFVRYEINNTSPKPNEVRKGLL